MCSGGENTLASIAPRKKDIARADTAETVVTACIRLLTNGRDIVMVSLVSEGEFVNSGVSGCGLYAGHIQNSASDTGVLLMKF